MTDNKIQCFKNAAIKFFQDEIEAAENAKISLDGIDISSRDIANSAASALINKGPRAAAKSILEHASEFASNTTSFLSSIGSSVQQDLQDILSGANLTGINTIDDLVNSTFKNVIISMSSNPSTVYGLSKRASQKAANDAGERINVSGDIISKINELREARSLLSSPPLGKDPEEATNDAIEDLNYAKNLLSIVASGLESSDPGQPTAGIIRRETSYNQSIKSMSDAMDELKIGSGSFKLAEYLKLRLEYKVLVNKFSGLNFDIQTSIENVSKAVTDYESNKYTRNTVEAKYINDVIDKLDALIGEMNAAIAKNSEALVLENFENWSRDLLSIYTLAHAAFDVGIDEALEPSQEDRQGYNAIKSSFDSSKDSLNADDLISSMTFLGELYFNSLRGGRYAESDIRSREDSITGQLLSMISLDRQIINDNSSYNPSVPDVLGVILQLTERSGLDKISDAISGGNVSGFFSLLTEQLGSSASTAASCLSSSLNDIEDFEFREILLRANSRMQAIQRAKQIAGSTRESINNKAKSGLNDKINRATRIKAELEGIGL